MSAKFWSKPEAKAAVVVSATVHRSFGPVPRRDKASGEEYVQAIESARKASEKEIRKQREKFSHGLAAS